MSAVTKPVGKLVGSVLGLEAPKMPDMTPPTVEAEPVKEMPTPDDAKVKAAQRKAIAEQRRRRGRASTILTANDDAMGG